MRAQNSFAKYTPKNNNKKEVRCNNLMLTQFLNENIVNMNGSYKYTCSDLDFKEFVYLTTIFESSVSMNSKIRHHKDNREEYSSDVTQQP